MVLTSGHKHINNKSDNGFASDEDSYITTAKKQKIDNNSANEQKLHVKPQLEWHVQNRPNYHPLALYRPYDVTFMKNGDIAVVDGFWPHSRIQIFNQSGLCTKSIGQGLILPFGIAVSGDDEIFITDHHERTVKGFTSNGELICNWGRDMFEWPNGIAIGKRGNFVVTDWAKGAISIHERDGAKINEFQYTDSETDSSQFCPQYVTIDEYGRIIVTDSYDHTVKIFDNEGSILRKIGGREELDGKIINPKGIAIDNGNIIVADWGQNCLLEYNADGKFIQEILNQDDGLKNPWGVETNSDGHLVVSEQRINTQPSLKMFVK